MTEKLHVIDGVTYREVERKAQVGDYVVLVRPAFDYSKYSSGTVFKVTDFELDYEEGVIASLEGTNFRLFEREYHVLEPVDTCDICGKGATVPMGEAYKRTGLSPEDIIANLVRRVAQLEGENAKIASQLDDALKNVYTFGEQTEANSDAIRTLDERTQPLVALGSLFAGGERQ